MKKISFHTVFIIGICLIIVLGCQQKQETIQEITQEELTAAVPALSDLHTAVYPLWHDAFPDKDYDLIKKLLPELDSLSVLVDLAELPGILQDKQEAWDEGKAKLLTCLEDLHKATETDNKDEMLNHTEAFHTHFEGLVRTIRPIVKELDLFHQEMYKLYHYHMPNYDLGNIRTTVSAMLEKIPALKAVQLPGRLEDRQEQFETSVTELEKEVKKLAEIVKNDDRKTIEVAVEEIHTAYQGVAAIFD